MACGLDRRVNIPVPIIIPPPTPQDVAIALAFGIISGIGFTLAYLLRKPVGEIAKQATAGVEWPKG